MSSEMAEDQNIVSFNTLPTELLFKIFLHLPVKELMKSRKVCLRWLAIIDALAKNEAIWNRHCQQDFKDYYWLARRKADRNLSWYHLYKSLSLWPRLGEAVEESDEFAPAHSILEEVRSVEILPSGMIGVHKKKGIQYYDVNTFKLTAHAPISGEYARYTENDSLVIVQSYHLHLYIIPKLVNNEQTTLTSVKLFLLTDNELYYVKLNDKIYVYDVYNKEDLKSTYINRTLAADGVMSLGYSDNCLNVLTYYRRIYTIKNKEMVFIKTISSKENILNVLYKYNFLEQLDWRIYFQWMYVLNHTVPEGPMRDIIIIRSYGDTFFVGTNSGVLSIFYRPFINGEIDLFNTVPIRQINFMQRADIPILAVCPILHIDVLEVENGHTIFVAMPKKVAVLKFTHNFSRPAPWTLKPYELHCLT